jgi:hypothetical protein
MGIEKVRRWQWIAISLVVGLLVVEVRRAVPRQLSYYGSELPDQKTFEAAIVREYDGHRLFRDLVVYPVEVDEGGRKTLKHFVAGQYFHGRPRKEGGAWKAEWKPYCFVADLPFTPWTSGNPEDPRLRVSKALIEASRKASARSAGVSKDPEASDAPATAPAEASAGPQTVVDYLRRMRRERGVQFTYAWWHHPRWQRAIWVTGSFLVIGLVWPTFVNLMTFGTLRRPPDEATGPGWGEALRGVFGRRRTASASPQAAGDDNAVREYDAALEAQLSNGAGANDPIAAIGPDLPQPAAPAVPSPAHEPVTVADAPHEEHHYEAKRDDFYPTEKKPVPHG